MYKLSVNSTIRRFYRYLRMGLVNPEKLGIVTCPKAGISNDRSYWRRCFV